MDIDQLESIVGRDQLRSIENRQRGNDVLHCYRISTKLNHHGYGNYRPNLHNVFKFHFISPSKLDIDLLFFFLS